MVPIIHTEEKGGVDRSRKDLRLFSSLAILNPKRKRKANSNKKKRKHGEVFDRNDDDFYYEHKTKQKTGR